MSLKSSSLALGALLLLASSALANTITITSSALPTLNFGASADSMSLTAGSATINSPGSVVFQTGAIAVGNSQIPDQVIPFLFNDTITLNGITKTLSISGQDSVTSSADIITIFSATPVTFGAYTFSLNSSSYNATTIGQSIPVNLSANIAASPVPEPATLSLLATGGLIGGTVLRSRARHLITC